MAYNIVFGKHFVKYMKKTKDKHLKQAILNAIYNDIAEDPYDAGDAKMGDLNNFYAYKLRYSGVQYRIAYSIDDKGRIVIITLAGTRENFYQELKRLRS